MPLQNWGGYFMNGAQKVWHVGPVGAQCCIDWSLNFWIFFFSSFILFFIYIILLTEIVIHFDVAASRRIFLFLSGSYPTTFSFPFNSKFSRFAVCLFSVSWLNFSVLDAAIRVRGNDGVVCGYT